MTMSDMEREVAALAELLFAAPGEVWDVGSPGSLAAWLHSRGVRPARPDDEPAVRPSVPGGEDDVWPDPCAICGEPIPKDWTLVRRPDGRAEHGSCPRDRGSPYGDQDPEVPELPELPELSRLRLEPGDTLVFNYPGPISGAQVEALHDRVSAALPGVPALVLYGGVTLGVINHGDRADEG